MAEIIDKRRRISGIEVKTLRTIYQYRFVTAGLLAERGLFHDPSNARRHLKRLVDLGLIGLHYDKSYKILGRPGVYHLLPAGIKVLRYAEEPVENEVAHLILRDPKASARFEQHCLGVLEAANALQASNPADARFISKSQLYGYENVLRPLPDGFITIGERHFFIELIDDALPIFALNKRLDQYVEDLESGEWEEHESYYPTLVLLTTTSTQLAKRRKTAYSHLSQGESDLKVYGTSLEQLKEQPGRVYLQPIHSFELHGELIDNL